MFATSTTGWHADPNLPKLEEGKLELEGCFSMMVVGDDKMHITPSSERGQQPS